MVMVMRREGAPTPGVTLMQARVIKQAYKNYRNAVDEVWRIYSRMSNRPSPGELAVYQRYKNNRNKRLEIYLSMLKKVFPNNTYSNTPSIFSNKNIAKMVIYKRAPLILKGARQHHLKWFKNMVNSGKSTNEIAAEINRRFKSNPRPSPRRNSPRRQNPFRPNSVRQSESRAIARRQAQHGPSNNTHITWSRNANGKINIHKTLRNLEFSLTNKQKKTLENMPENQAVKALRWFAREAQLR